MGENTGYIYRETDDSESEHMKHITTKHKHDYCNMTPETK